MAESKRKGSSSFKLYAGVSVSFLAIWWIIRSVGVEDLVGALKSADVKLLALALLVTILSYILRAARWPVFFSEAGLSFAQSFKCLILGFFFNNILPARIGELVRAHLGGREAKQSRARVLATIVGERLADGVTISALFALLFTFASHGHEISQAKEVYYVACLFALAALSVIFMLLCRERVYRVLNWAAEIVPGHISGYTLSKIKKMIEGMEPMLHPRKAFKLSVFSLIIWSVELLVYYLVAKAFSVPMSLGGIALFMAAVNFSSLIPAAPGGIGVIEAIAAGVLVQIGIADELAVAMVISQHAIQIFVVGVPGAYFLWKIGGHVPEMEDEEEEADTAEVRDVSSIPRSPTSIKRPPSASFRINAFDQGSLELSVVIPAYNEEQRLPRTLLSVLEMLAERGDEFEVIVVNDGSDDDTSEVVRQSLRLSNNVRLISCSENMGKGYAVKQGVLNARGKRILYMDADGATSVTELVRLEAAMSPGIDVVIGSRAAASRETKVVAHIHRRVMGRVFNGIVNFLMLPGIADTQCGFKLFERSAARHIFSAQTCDGFGFDVEVLYLARKAGCRIAEVPVNWTNIPGSKVNVFTDSPKMFAQVIGFKMRDLFGGYKSCGSLKDLAKKVLPSN